MKKMYPIGDIKEPNYFRITDPKVDFASSLKSKFLKLCSRNEIPGNTQTQQYNVRSLLQTALGPHVIGAEVGVAARAVPVPGDGFGVEGHDHAKVLADAMQDEAGRPQVVAHVDALCRTHLELPLQGNHSGQWDSAKELQSHTSIYLHFASFNLVIMHLFNLKQQHLFSAVKVELSTSSSYKQQFKVSFTKRPPL
jgi:hypothetical protein